MGSANILEATRKNKIKSLIYVTSDKCYLNLGLKKNFKEQDTLEVRITILHQKPLLN